MKIITHYIGLPMLLLAANAVLAQDTSVLLKKVTVSSLRKKNFFTTALPSQSLSRESLQQINAPSIGDAARFFSGVLIRDYGGAGGLKTISVRSLGATNTGITYDGVPLTDAQSGQIDLSKYSSTFLQSLDLYHANMQGLLLPARTYSSASVLSIYTQSYYPQFSNRPRWQAGLRAGSFNFWQPFAGVKFSISPTVIMDMNTEFLYSKGDYPFTLQNGNLSEKTRRDNSQARSLQGEVNVMKLFRDSSVLQVKGWGYNSSRGLPGAIIFFNDRSVEHLWNREYFFQAHYQKEISYRSSLLLLAKFNHTWTRYTDPDFLNGAGGIDSRYWQGEGYFSAAFSHKLSPYLAASIASDASIAGLRTNEANFNEPIRTSLWNNFSLHYTDSLLQVSGSILWTGIYDKSEAGAAADNTDAWVPALAASIKTGRHSPFMIRAFYKHAFRMPTFNDYYYSFIGNTGLRPEYTRQVNAGVVYSKRLDKKLKQVNISIDGYYNTIKDKIVAVPGQNLFSWTMLNLGKVHIKGIDLTTELSGLIGAHINWFTRVAYTWQQAQDMTDPSSSKYKDRIPYTPDHSGSGLLSFQYKKWSAGYSFTFSGTRYILGENNPANQLDGWGTHDVFVSRSLESRHFTTTVKAELNNITDERYDVIKFYPMPGRSFKISLLFNNL